MTISLSPTEFQAQTALRRFLLAVAAPFASPLEVIAGQANRVPEPKSADFIVITPISRERLSTNVDHYVDAKLRGAINGTLMNISTVFYGSLKVGSVLFGTGIIAGTSITSFASGTGGVGTYVVSPTQVSGTGVIAAGVASILQPVMITFQLDVHGPHSSDVAQVVSTLMRDEYGTQQFKELGFPDVIPLYADDPKQVPFINGENQYETRWVLYACVEAGQTINDIPQAFADELRIDEFVPVDIFYQAD